MPAERHPFTRKSWKFTGFLEIHVKLRIFTKISLEIRNICDFGAMDPLRNVDIP